MEKEVKKVDVRQAFINRKLKAINQMTNKAKQAEAKNRLFSK